MEYVGIRSKSYWHIQSPNIYDPNNPMVYYQDLTRKADFRGPSSDEGLPKVIIDKEERYFPVTICLFALGHYELFRIKGQQENSDFFRFSCDWLLNDQGKPGDWLTHVDVKKFGLKSPWPSAMAQGLGISCLTRGYELFGDQRYLDAAERALGPFHKSIDDGGVTSTIDGMAIYDEYPSPGGFHVLNGFIFALWGLLDMIRIVDNQDARRLYDNGLATLKKILPRFDIGYWSLYNISDGMKNPASVPYHRIHIDQLDAMYCITGDEIYLKYRDLWSGYLGGRYNAIRSLPRKLLWNIIHGF